MAHGGAILTTFRIPTWYKKPDPGMMGGSPMATALGYIRRIAEEWCRDHQESVPPVVIHITDGDAFDGDPEPEAARLKAVTTDGRPLLLFNLFLTETPTTPVMFATDDDGLDDARARMLFRMSSIIPPEVCSWLQDRGISCPEAGRGLLVNADPSPLVLTFRTGT